MNRFRGLIGLAVVAILAGFAPAPFDEKIDYKTSAWQKETDEGYLPYHKLNWDEFPSKPAADSHSAFTQGFIHYNFKMRWTSDGSRAKATVTSFEVRSGFDTNKSWRKPSASFTERLLVHEQGHLDINELGARALRQIRLTDLPTATGSTGDIAMQNLSANLKELVDERIKLTQQRQDQYDEDTNHGLKPQQQADWTAKLKKELDAN